MRRLLPRQMSPPVLCSVICYMLHICSLYLSFCNACIHALVCSDTSASSQQRVTTLQQSNLTWLVCYWRAPDKSEIYSSAPAPYYHYHYLSYTQRHALNHTQQPRPTYMPPQPHHPHPSTDNQPILTHTRAQSNNTH